jgi:hypothetical protein
MECGANKCPEDCKFGAWGAWGKCSKTCGGGEYKRTRAVASVAVAGGKACMGDLEQIGTCNENVPCPIDCKMGVWKPWEECITNTGVKLGTSPECKPNDADIKSIKQKSQRQVLVEAAHGGKECPKNPFTEKEQECHFDWKCPWDCQHSEWTAWAGCPACQARGGSPKQNRTRKVTKAASALDMATKPMQKAGKCDDDIMMQEKACDNLPDCARDCTLSEWDFWQECSASCTSDGKPNKQKRKRYVIEERWDAGKCDMPKEEERVCNEQKCVDDGFRCSGRSGDMCVIIPIDEHQRNLKREAEAKNAKTPNSKVDVPSLMLQVKNMPAAGDPKAQGKSWDSGYRAHPFCPGEYNEYNKMLHSSAVLPMCQEVRDSQVCRLNPSRTMECARDNHGAILKKDLSGNPADPVNMNNCMLFDVYYKDCGYFEQLEEGTCPSDRQPTEQECKLYFHLPKYKYQDDKPTKTEANAVGNAAEAMPDTEKYILNQLQAFASKASDELPAGCSRMGAEGWAPTDGQPAEFDAVKWDNYAFRAKVGSATFNTKKGSTKKCSKENPCLCKSGKKRQVCTNDMGDGVGDLCKWVSEKRTQFKKWTNVEDDELNGWCKGTLGPHDQTQIIHEAKGDVYYFADVAALCPETCGICESGKPGCQDINKQNVLKKACEKVDSMLKETPTFVGCTPPDKPTASAKTVTDEAFKIDGVSFTYQTLRTVCRKSCMICDDQQHVCKQSDCNEGTLLAPGFAPQCMCKCNPGYGQGPNGHCSKKL